MFGRRSLLQSAAAAASTAPFARPLRAAADSKKVRLVTWFNGCGNIHEHWNPRGTEKDFTFGRILKPLEPWKHKMVVLGGINNRLRSTPGIHHHIGGGTFLTATRINPPTSASGSNISIDQFVAQKISTTARFKSVELSVFHDSQHSGPRAANRFHYTGPGKYLNPEKDPYAAFDRLFKDVVVDPGAAEAIRTQRKSIMDHVREELNVVSSRLGGESRLRLEQHLSSLREIEAALAAGGVTAGCGKPSLEGTRPNPSANKDIPRISRLQINNAIAALSCDLTRVVNIDHGPAQNDMQATWLGINDQFHHTLSHASYNNKDAYEKMTKILTWYMEELAVLVKGLDAIREADGSTLLDNTLILAWNELGHSNRHDFVGIPVLLIGRAGGRLQTGRWLQYDGASHSDVLVSVANLMGQEITTFGEKEFCDGPLKGLT